MQILTTNTHWLSNSLKDAHGNYKKVVNSHGERSRWRKSTDKELVSWQGKGKGGQREGTVDTRTQARGGACHVSGGVWFGSLLTFSSKRYCWSNSRE